MKGQTCWIVPVAPDKERSAQEIIGFLVGEEGLFALRQPRGLKEGDGACFYAKGIGVIAHGEVASSPSKSVTMSDYEEYPWVFRLRKSKLYVNKPVALDANTKNLLNATRAPKNWGWLVQAAHRITLHDFLIFTRAHGSGVLLTAHDSHR
jgi:hypothetical protein